MKRAFLTVLLVALLCIPGCAGGEPHSASSGDTQSAPEAEETVSAEISKLGTQVWADSLGSVWAHGAVEIRNNGNLPIRIGDISISFVGTDGSILDVCTMVLPVPHVVAPGEVAYAGESTVVAGASKPSDVARIEANIDYRKTDTKPQILEVTDLKILAPTMFEGPKVTGRVKNTSDKSADDIRIAVAAFDEEGNLLGVYYDSPDVTLSPGSTLGFATSYPPIEAKDFYNRVHSLVGKAYNWRFGD